MISVIIPTLNEEASLPALLERSVSRKRRARPSSWTATAEIARLRLPAVAGPQIGRAIRAARLRNALPPRRTTYAERLEIARELRRGVR